MDDSKKEGLSEEARVHGKDLATRIRFLREEIKEGRNTVDNLAELESKEKALRGIVPMDEDTARINFEVRDMFQTQADPSGPISCLRVVQIDNPTKRPEAQGIKTVSLLAEYERRENLVIAPPSEILPPAFRGR